ncbi:MAG: hypothetical protein S4CHLAM102_12880 [Chlamydiia bacterium]|nr:hypothetical protein [Chlamydiia bacterium]
MYKTLIIAISFSIGTAWGETERFSDVIHSTYQQYEAKKYQTNWHRELWHDYNRCTEQSTKQQFSAMELKSLGMKEEFIDQMMIEYIKKSETIYVIFFFPPISHDKTRALNWLSQYGTIVYTKDLYLKDRGVKNLLRGIYDVHHCNGWQRTYDGIYERFEHLLIPNQLNTISVIVVEGPELMEIIDCKRKIRADHNKDNRIIHMTDRHHEAVHCAELVFNQNSINFIKYVKPKNFGPFVDYTMMLQQYLRNSPEFHDLYCVDTGGAMAAYGIRRPGDYDLILEKGITSPFRGWGHNNVTREKYGSHPDDILHNPREHVYHKGLRFVKIENVLQFKKHKLSPKDQADIVLINQFLADCAANSY